MAYEFLAGCYDAFTADVHYARWADYLEKHFARSRLPIRTVLDLACGTGSLTRVLAERGYEMIGADLSQEMLAQAAEKCRGAGPIEPIFLHQAMEELDLYGTIDACVCCLDSINYVTSPKKLARAFRRVHTFLMPGGLFLFDINTPQKLRGLDGQMFLDESEDAYCVWRADWSERRRICTYGMDIFRLDPGGLWSRWEEVHEEYAYEPAELDAPVKASAITAKEMVERARQIHKTLPVATAALGRSLMAASMMGNQLKEKDGSVTLRIKGGGPLGGITVVSDSQGNARGYVVNPLVDLPLKGPAKLDVGSAVGRDGSLTVIKDLCMKEPYVGTVPLVSGEIAEDITSYFAESEQIPTACALGVLVDVDQSVQCAGGYLIQLLPGADDAAISAIEQGIARVGPVTEALRGGLSARELVEQVLSEFQLEVLSEEPVEYRCYCSRERVTRALISMGREELNSLIREQGRAELTCQFCDKVYHYTNEELEGLLASL